MDTKFEFLASEKSEYITIFKRTREATSDSSRGNDEVSIKSHLETFLKNGLITKDTFGLDFVLNSMQAAEIAVNEIGLKRDDAVAISLYQSVVNGYLDIDDVSVKYGEVVTHTTYDLVRINALCSKNSMVEGESFRNLPPTFAEDMRITPTVITNRVNLMRHIRDVEDVEAKQQVDEEVSYLYAPLIHRLGLYQLRSELEDLSLKYLEHGAYYMIKDELNVTEKVRGSYIMSFINPIQRELEGAGLKFQAKGRTKSTHSIW